jgi:[ribosomal protein S5]-alanine N-acetyltransferase
MKIQPIHTERLVLIPFTLEAARALYAGDKAVLAYLGLQATPYWPDQESMDTLPRIIKRLEEVKEPTGFESWMIVLKRNNTVIGDAGFKGPPTTEGVVDIGYSIIEQEHQRGYGLETARALVGWAFLQPSVKAVTASCLLENAASIRILEKLGMEELVRDDEVIYWRLEQSRAGMVFAHLQ